MSRAKLFTREEIIDAIKEGKSSGRAAQLLNVDRRTFKKNADRFGLYGTCCHIPGPKFEFMDILGGHHPQYPTSHLSKRLVKEGVKEYKCESCGIKKYNGSDISLELNHIDGDNSNHALINLELLCPNCHSQTPTYRSKKLTYMKK